MTYARVKRALDLLFLFAASPVLLPAMGIVALLVRLDSPGPVWFAQKRTGVRGTFFMLYKFRTMRIDTPGDTPTHLLRNPDAYITRVGRFLRKTSLDELPQAVNILRGDMSLIGPRPALWNQYDLIAEREKYGANDILPGLTGWAQVNGRDELPIPVKAAFDGEYRAKVSLLFDARIFLLTLWCVVSRRGVSEGER